MAVIDAILFFNELDLLEIRVNELHRVVDKFLVIQSDTTFSGQKKRLFSIKDNKMLSPFKKQIIFHNVTDMPSGNDPWLREKHQRNSIAAGLQTINSNMDDRILISDVDEIPRADSVLKASKLTNPTLLQLRYFYYYVNVRGVTLPWWPLLRMATHRDLLPDAQKIRDIPENDPLLTVIPDAGWHFSYIGGKERIKEKIAAFSHHQEYNKPEFTSDNHLEKVLKDKSDLFNRKMPLFRHRLKIFGRRISWKQVKIDNTYPKYLLSNKKRFSYMIAT